MSHVTFTDRLWLHDTKRSVELISFAGGHTDSVSFLYLPAERIAFMSDLLSMRHQPWLGDGNPEEWVRISNQVQPVAIDGLVPGHGQPGTMADMAMIRGISERSRPWPHRAPARQTGTRPQRSNPGRPGSYLP